MRALQLTGVDRPLELVDLPQPVINEGELLVEIKAAGLNRRDYWITQGKYPRLQFPLVLGSDAAGIADSREVLINPGLDWGVSSAYQSDQFNIIGFPRPGTLAEYIAVPASYVHPMPTHLSFTEAAALPLAGVTAYRALFSRGDARMGENLLVTGAGGGVASMAIQFGVAHGMEVYVTSGSEEKLERSQLLGAHGGVNYQDEDAFRKLKRMAGGFDLIIDGTGGSTFSHLLKLCNPGARIVIYGGSLGAIDGLSPQHLFWRQISIIGTSMGSPSDFQAMLQFVAGNKLIPQVHATYALEQANVALSIMADSRQFGKLVIDMKL